MLTLQKLQIKNVYPFKTASLDLDHKGVTVIRGLNKDAGGVSNAAGKSALVSSFPELILDETPAGKATKIKGKKLGKKAVRIVAKRGKHEWSVTKKFGKSKDYEILRDGKATNSRTVNYNKNKIAEIFGLSDTQFYSRFYIDSTIPHPLFSAKAVVRQEYIVELFQLNDVDNIRRLLNAELNAIVKKGIEYKAVKTSIDELRDDFLPKAERLDLKERLAQLQERQSKLTIHLQASQAASELMAFERTHKGLIAELASITTLEELPVVYKAVRNKIQKLKEQRDSAADWEVYDRSLRLHTKEWEPARLALEAAGLESEEDARHSAEQLREYEADSRKLRSVLEDPGSAPKKPEKPKYERDRCLAEVSRLKHELSNIKVLGGGTCPTCGQPVSTRDKATVESDLAKWVRRRDQTDAWQSYTHEKDAWTSQHRAFTENSEKLAKLKKKCKRLEPVKKVMELLDRVPVRPTKPKHERPEGFNEKKLERLTEQASVLRQGMDLLETLKACAGLSSKQREKAEQSSKFLSELNEIQSETSSLAGKVASQSEIARRLKRLKERAAALAEECKDEKVLRAFVDAYSKQGLKKFMIERYSKMLEEQVNKYRKIFFEEDYTFEFTYDNVLVHRKYGKKVETSDVRRLSGAEKRMFTLLLVVSTTTMLPADKRLNVLILDEPEANMGPGFVEKLVKTLPLLQKLIPHIIFVTPRTEIEIPDSRVYTVVKQNGVATLNAKVTSKE